MVEFDATFEPIIAMSNAVADALSSYPKHLEDPEQERQALLQ